MPIPTETCTNQDHRDLGFSYIVYPKTDDPKERVLFFGCIGCWDDRFTQKFPDCPEKHRPYRFSNSFNEGCHACRTYQPVQKQPVNA